MLGDAIEVQAPALAQCVKRLSFTEIEACAVDTDETRVMRDAIVKLQVEHERVGYAPC